MTGPQPPQSQQLRLGNGHHQRAQRRQLDRPGTRRRLTRRYQLDRVDVKIKEFAAELQGGLGDVLSVGTGPDGDADAKHRRLLFHANPRTCTAQRRACIPRPRS